MTGGEKRVYDFICAQPGPVHGKFVAESLPDLNPNSVSAWLSMLAGRKDLYAKACLPGQGHGRGKLYCDLPFEVDYHGGRVSNPKAKIEQEIDDESDSGESRDEKIARMRREYEERLAAEKRGEKPVELPEAAVGKLVTALAPQHTEVTRQVVNDFQPRRRVTTAVQVVEEMAPTNRRIEFPIPGKQPAVIEFPSNADADDLDMVMVMLEAYGARAFGRKAA